MASCCGLSRKGSTSDAPVHGACTQESEGLVPLPGPGPKLEPHISEEQWVRWEREARPPSTYDPVQLTRLTKLLVTLPCGHCTLCGCGHVIRQACCVPCFKQHLVRISDPDWWLLELLKNPHPKCPERFRGVFWMQDNPGSETLVTMQDGDWQSERIMLKSSRFNWTVNANDYHGLLLTAYWWFISGGPHQFEVSPTGKWAHIQNAGGGGNYIYLPEPGETLRNADGTPLDWDPTQDMLRISYEKPSDPTSAPYFFYRVRRIAYLNAQGGLVTTKGYEDLLALAQSSNFCTSNRGPYAGDQQAVTFVHDPPKQLCMRSNGERACF